MFNRTTFADLVMKGICLAI